MWRPDKRVASAAMVCGGTGLLIGGFLGLAIGASWSRDDHARPRAVAKGPPSILTAPQPATPPPVVLPVAPTPTPVPPTPREVGPSPYRLQSMTLHRWEGDAWRVRANLMVTRLREAPDGTGLGTKMACWVDGVTFVSAGLIAPPGGPLAVGETGATFVDHFFHTPFPGTPQRCELMLYVQMPGAPADAIDHDAGRICVLPDGATDQVTGAPCPVEVEAPLPTAAPPAAP